MIDFSLLTDHKPEVALNHFKLSLQNIKSFRMKADAKNFVIGYAMAKDSSLERKLKNLSEMYGVIPELHLRAFFEEIVLNDSVNFSLSDEKIAKIIDQINKDVSKTQRLITEKISSISKIEENLKKNEVTQNDLEKTVLMLENLAKSINSELSSFKQSIALMADEIVRLQKELEEKKDEVMRDHLSSLLNNRALDEFRSVHNDNSEFAVVVIDADNFKNINDTYGHIVGDAVIAHIGKTINKITKQYNGVHAFRFGGEEFVLIIDKTKNNPKEIAELIHSEVENKTLKIKDREEHIKVTVTIGISFDEHTLDENFENADRRLYLGKQEGKNRIKYSG